MNVRSGTSLYAAAFVIGTFGISLNAVAGDGAGCREKAAYTDAEGGANGQISGTEHAASAQKRFDAMDANGDGKVTASEIGASQGAERIAWAKKPMSADDKIRKFDQNKDGALSASEYAAGSQAMFEKLDADGDGHLRANEIELNDLEKMTARDAQ